MNGVKKSSQTFYLTMLTWVDAIRPTVLIPPPPPMAPGRPPYCLTA